MIYKESLGTICQSLPLSGHPKACADFYRTHADALFSDSYRLTRSNHPVNLNDIILNGDIARADVDRAHLVASLGLNKQSPTPFGETIALLDQVLGWEYRGEWHWLPHHRMLRDSFWMSLQLSTGVFTRQQRRLVLASRCRALIVRFGTEVGRGGLHRDAAYRCLLAILQEADIETFGGPRPMIGALL